MAVNCVGSWTDTHAASRTSIDLPLGKWIHSKLAGRVAASFAITRSPGLKRLASTARGRCFMRPSLSTISTFADRASELSAVVIGVPRRDGRWGLGMYRAASRQFPQEHPLVASMSLDR